MAKARTEHFEETEDGYELTISVPGLRPSDLMASILFEGEMPIPVVKLAGETKTKHHTFTIARELQLPPGADHETVSVTLVDGLITIHALKRAKTEPQELPISTDVIDEAGQGEDGYRVTLLVPGVKADALKLTLEGDGVLLVEGESSHRGKHKLRVNRRLKLPRNSDFGSMSCSLVDGVLTVVAPKCVPAEREPRQLFVQACLPGECA